MTPEFSPVLDGNPDEHTLVGELPERFRLTVEQLALPFINRTRDRVMIYCANGRWIGRIESEDAEGVMVEVTYRPRVLYGGGV